MLLTCWSNRQQMRNAERNTRIHLQGKAGRTLCGIQTGDGWEFEAWADSERHQADVTCVLCKRASRGE